MSYSNKVAGALLNLARKDGFAGYDPFDSLNSVLFQATPLKHNEFARLAWLQLGKRSPINLRPLLRVPKRRNPKGVGLFILGLLEDYRRTGEQQYLSEAKELGDWLLTQQSPRDQWQHSCWGYHFDWQARAFYVPAGKPNIITTCYVARALYALGEALGEQGFMDVALDAGHFIVNSLYTEADGRCFYAYIPGETAFVHNASLWGAAWVGFVGARLNDDAMCQQALEVARQSVREQGEDGSWVYGARHHHQFIDGFHTGYNLEALCFLRDALSSTEFNAAIGRGYHYYINHFFTEDGTAKYYNNSVYPIDMHSVAQAVFTLLKVGGSEVDEVLCEKVIARAFEQLYLPGKTQFVYQKSRWLTNSINYTRWTQAWAYFALAFYNRYQAEQQNEKN